MGKIKRNIWFDASSSAKRRFFSAEKKSRGDRPKGGNEVSIKPFQRFAGSQGRALSRTPQSPKSPFETRCPTRVSIKTNKKERPSFRTVFPMSGQWPRSISLAAASDYFFVLVDFRKSENQKGIPRPAGRGSGLCPENPQPFEKGWRKLQFFPLTAADAGVSYPRSVCRLPAKSQHNGWVRYRSNGWSHRGNPAVQNG